MRYAMAVDTKKCVGCSDCVVACQTENNVPIGLLPRLGCGNDGWNISAT